MLNCANGVLDLGTGQLYAHDPGLLMMQNTKIDYDPSAECPMFMEFMSQVQESSAVRGYLQRVAGYSLTGDTREQVFFLHHGVGQNGKSVFMSLLHAVMGDYAQTIPRSTLMVSKSDSIPTDVARMFGKRLLTTSETKAGATLDMELIKDLTGGETTSARMMRKDFFDFKPTGKIHLTTNHLPFVGVGLSVSRRLRDIGWDYVVSKPDPTLFAKIAANELPGILNWAVQGCIEWHSRGLHAPKEVLEKTWRHLDDGDFLGDWVLTCTTPAPADAWVQLKVLYDSYAPWAEARGERPMRIGNLSEALRERGYRSRRASSPDRSMLFYGIKLQHEIGKPTHYGQTLGL